jgi:hypothetical protein
MRFALGARSSVPRGTEGGRIVTPDGRQGEGPGGPRIVGMMAVYDAAAGDLATSLRAAEQICDRIVVLARPGEAATAEVCRGFPTVALHRDGGPEATPDRAAWRQRLWQLALDEGPDWVLALDADERFEDGAAPLVRALCATADYDVVCFRVFDLWGAPDQVRVDGAWNPWHRFTPLLVRAVPGVPAAFAEPQADNGRFPKAYDGHITFYSHLRVQRWGWVDAAQHATRQVRWRERDLAERGEVSARTQSVLVPDPVTEPWCAQPMPTFRLGRFD